MVVLVSLSTEVAALTICYLLLVLLLVYVTRLVLENSPVSRAPVDKILAARRKETQGAAFSRSDTPSLAVVRSRQGRFWATEGDLYQWGRARGRVSPDADDLPAFREI